MYATRSCNVIIEAAPNDVPLRSLNSAWITITVHLPLIQQCWENQWEWSRRHAILAFLHCKSLASLARSKETIGHCIWRVSYWARTATQYELRQFQFPKHVLYHHFDIVQNTRRSYLLWGTWRALWYMAASSFPAFNRPRKGLYLHTRFDVELFMWAQGNALWWQCSLCHS